MSENRRRYFRLDYPHKSGPKLVSSGIVLEVLDISEQGMMIHAKQDSNLLSPGTIFSGSLTFADGESLLVIGKIARVNQDKISIELRKPIPLRIIRAEQRRIIQNFKQRA